MTQPNCDHQFVKSGNDAFDVVGDFLFGDGLRYKCVKCGEVKRA